MTDPVKQIPLEFFVNKLLAHESFSTVRFGDGEFLCLNGAAGQNSDGTKYRPQLRQELLGSLRPRPNYFRACQPNFCIDPGNIQSLLDLHPGGEWFDANLFQKANWSGRLWPLVQALQARKCLFVIPQFVAPAVRDIFGSVRVYIAHGTDALDQQESLFAYIAEHLAKFDVIVFSCGMAKGGFISRLHDLYPGRLTLLDAGSIWDGYTGKITRRHYKEDWTDWPAMLRLNQGLKPEDIRPQDVFVGVKTYLDKAGANHEKRFEYFRQTLISLLSTCSNRITIVDDGSNTNHLSAFENNSRFKIIRLQKNGGVAAAQNTLLIEFWKSGSPLAVLLDDDVELSPGWIEAVIERVKTGKDCEHTYAQIQGLEVQAGYLLTISRNVLQEVGGFSVVKKYSGEHQWYLNRAKRAGFSKEHLGAGCPLPASHLAWHVHANEAELETRKEHHKEIREVFQKIHATQNYVSPLGQFSLTLVCPIYHRPDKAAEFIAMVNTSVKPDIPFYPMLVYSDYDDLAAVRTLLGAQKGKLGGDALKGWILRHYPAGSSVGASVFGMREAITSHVLWWNDDANPLTGGDKWLQVIIDKYREVFYEGDGVLSLNDKISGGVWAGFGMASKNTLAWQIKALHYEYGRYAWDNEVSDRAKDLNLYYWAEDILVDHVSPLEPCNHPTQEMREQQKRDILVMKKRCADWQKEKGFATINKGNFSSVDTSAIMPLKESDFIIGIKTFVKSEARNLICRRSIESLLATTQNKIILTDDESPWPGFQAWLDTLDKRVTVLHNKHGGVAEQQNRLLRLFDEANAIAWVLCDDDVLFKAGWLRPAVLKMNSGKWLHLVGEPTKSKCGPLPGICLFGARGLVANIGGFWDKSTYGYEHNEYTFRAQHAGLAPDGDNVKVKIPIEYLGRGQVANPELQREFAEKKYAINREYERTKKTGIIFRQLEKLEPAPPATPSPKPASAKGRILLITPNAKNIPDRPGWILVAAENMAVADYYFAANERWILRNLRNLSGTVYLPETIKPPPTGARVIKIPFLKDAQTTATRFITEVLKPEEFDAI